ncbi:MAG: YebC/PmpR family DNA-binding transcriptional regulator [Parcubacteria group bacterium]|jgi:YebC/PmpR family DNA-binding regulatory protein
MSGHSHWAGIKHKKAAQDAKRAGVFTKVARIVTLAAKEGGGDPATNFKLRLAIDQARSVNMPKDNVDRAIKRGTGELKDAAAIEEVIYEAMAPGNISMLIKVATDNKNRTLSELKAVFNKTNVKMVPSGSFKHLFRQVGTIYTATNNDNANEIELAAIDAGAVDTIFQGEMLQIITDPRDLKEIKDNLEKKEIKIDNAGLIFVPVSPIEINEETKIDYEKLLEKLDELDDVQEIYDNL